MIYLIACDETETCKIGYSVNPEKRLLQLQTGSPFILQLIATIEGDYCVEKEIHTRFKPFKLEGEWFIFNEEIKTFFGIEKTGKIYHAILPVLKECTLLSKVLVNYLFFKANFLNKISLLKEDIKKLTNGSF